MLAGAWSLVAGTLSARFRPIAYAAITVLAVLLVLHGKDYYFAAMHPLLIAAGAVALVRWSERRGWRWPRTCDGRVPSAGGRRAPAAGSADPPARCAGALHGATRDDPGGHDQPGHGAAAAAGFRRHDRMGGTGQHNGPRLPRIARSGPASRGGGRGQLWTRRRPRALHGPPGHDLSRSAVTAISTTGACPRARSTSSSSPVAASRNSSRCARRSSEEARVLNPWGVDEEQEVPIILCRGLRRPLPELWKLLGPDWG